MVTLAKSEIEGVSLHLFTFADEIIFNVGKWDKGETFDVDEKDVHIIVEAIMNPHHSIFDFTQDVKNCADGWKYVTVLKALALELIADDYIESKNGMLMTLDNVKCFYDFSDLTEWEIYEFKEKLFKIIA